MQRLLLTGTGGQLRSRHQLSRIPSLTVVIPCYNYGRYLRDCVTSVTTNQPGIDVDVLIIDDNSTDDSLQTALRIAEADPRVRVIAHQSNKGHIATQ